MQHISDINNSNDCPNKHNFLNGTQSSANPDEPKQNERQKDARFRPTKKQTDAKPQYAVNFKDTLSVFKMFVKATNHFNQEARYKIKGSHQNTFHFLLSRYADQLNQKHLFKQYKPGDPLPFFETYNSSLATSLSCTENTIRNHRKRLLDTGIIVLDTLGTKSVRIMLNPLLFSAEKLQQGDVNKYVKSLIEARKKQHETPSLEALNGVIPQNFAPIRVSSSSNSIKESTSSVDNIRRGPATDDAPKGCNPKQPDPKQPDPKRPAGSQIQNNEDDKQSSPSVQAQTPEILKVKEKNLSAGAGAETESHPDRTHPDEKKAAQLVLVMKLVEEFWRYAQSRLFHGKFFSEKRQRFILNTIFKYHFNTYQLDKPDEFYLNRLELYFAQVDTALNYLKTKPHLKLPEPEYYFQGPAPSDEDRRHEFKFYKTYKLYVNRTGYLTLNKIKKEVLDYKRGKGRFREKTLLGLYQLHEKRINEINLPQISAEFYQLATTLYKKR